MQDPELLILVGPNGVGKTTVGRCIARCLGYRWLAVEEFWLQRYDTIEEIYAKLPEAYRDFEDHVRQELAAADEPVVFESGGRNEHDVEMIRSLSGSFRTFLVKITADFDVCQQRVRERGTTANFPKTPEYVTQCHREFHEEYAPRYRFSLEVVNNGLSEDEICGAFRGFEEEWKSQEQRWGSRIKD